VGGDRGEGFRRVRGFARDDVARVLQELSRDGPERLVIVDDQHALGHIPNGRTPLLQRLRVFPGIERARWNPRAVRWIMNG
jgi:hypothetical protein